MRSNRLVILAILIFGSGAGHTEGVLETCRQADGDKARIACLEGAVAALEAQLNHQPRPAADLGAEQVPGQSKESLRDQRIRAKVTTLRFNGYNKLTVILDNGQIWKQLDGDSSNLRGRIDNSDDIDVDIKRSRFGGYRMLLTPPDKTVKVRRLE